jgi:multidrug efflux pump subunit AcrA (membrane-fusion protein)
MRKIIAIAILIVIFLGLSVWAIYSWQKRLVVSRELSKSQEIEVAVEVTKPEVKTIENLQSFLGSVVSTHEATVFSKIAGKVVSIPVSNGDRVYAGSTIAVVNVDEPGMKFRYYDAYSPIHGEVADVMVDVGDMVTPQTPIALVVKPESVKIETNVPADVLFKMVKGSEVKVVSGTLGEKQTITTEVTSLPSSLSPESHLAVVGLTPKGGSHGLRSGMFVEVEIPMERSDNALVIPNRALRRESEGTAVYVAENGVVVRRSVKTGVSTETEVEIIEGISPNDNVIAFANKDLREGIKISKIAKYSP